MKTGLALLFGAAALVRADTVQLLPSRDATLYSETSGDAFLNLANGSGDHLFAGRTGFDHRTLRRALVWFDVAAAVPSGARITSARLDFTVSRSPPGASTEPFTLHRLAAPWGEGTSDAFGEEGSGTTADVGDATWEYSFFGSLRWTTPGGDFDAAASGASSLNPLSDSLLTFQDGGLALDVQTWLDGGPNHGWMLLGNESVAYGSARRFYSRTAGIHDGSPVLTLAYAAVPEPATACLLMLGGGLLGRALRGRRARPTATRVSDISAAAPASPRDNGLARTTPDRR